MYPSQKQASKPEVSLSWGRRDNYKLNAFEIKYYIVLDNSVSKIRLLLGIKEVRKAVVPN